MATTMIEFLAKKNNCQNSLRVINSAILSGTMIIIGYTTSNNRYGRMAENFLHIGGRSVEWPIGYADPKTVADYLKEHAASIGRQVRIGFAETCWERGQQGSTWWREGTHLNQFVTSNWIP